MKKMDLQMLQNEINNLEIELETKKKEFYSQDFNHLLIRIISVLIITIVVILINNVYKYGFVYIMVMASILGLFINIYLLFFSKQGKEKRQEIKKIENKLQELRETKMQLMFKNTSKINK